MQPIQYTDIKDSKGSVQEGKEGLEFTIILCTCIYIYMYIYSYIHIHVSTLNFTNIGKSSTPYIVDEDPNECPVCKFIKGGECKDFFGPWDECMKSANDTDFASKCFKVHIYIYVYIYIQSYR
jgi:hypothetical protein